jgi:hypothetical protein
MNVHCFTKVFGISKDDILKMVNVQSPQEETVISKIASGMIKQDTLTEIFNES